MSVGPLLLLALALSIWRDRCDERRLLPRVASMRSYLASPSDKGVGDELRLPYRTTQHMAATKMSRPGLAGLRWPADRCADLSLHLRDDEPEAS